MSRRAVVTLLAAAGLVLQGLSFFVFSSSLATPTSPDFSNPRVPFASLIFVVGVALVFLSFVVYELLPGEKDE